MPVIWCGSSIADVVNTGGTVNTTGAQKSSVCAEAIDVSGANLFKIPVPFDLNDFWLSFYHYKSSNSGTPNQGMRFLNTAYHATNALFRILLPASSNAWRLSYWNGSAYVDNVDIGSGTTGVLYRYDIHVKISDSGGVFDVYRDGVLDCDLTTALSGDTKYTTATTINSIEFATMGVGQNTYSGIILADEDTRGMRLLQHLPTGNGADTSWTGDYTAVDETGFSDADMITSSTVGQHETFTYADINAGFTAYNVTCVALSGRAQASGSPGTIDGVARVGSTDYTLAPDYAAQAAFAPWYAQYDLNPATSLPWTVSDVNAAEFGVRAST